MEKGTFAKYINKVFRVSNIENGIIRLVSEDRSDLNNGFIEKIYPSNYKDRAYLPKLYIKEVKKEEIEEIFEIDYKAKYKDNIFNISSNKIGSQYRIGTTDAEIAQQNGFNRTDKYYYEKLVNQDEIDILKISKKLS